MKMIRRAWAPAVLTILAAGLAMTPASPAAAAAPALVMFTPTLSVTATIHGTGEDAFTEFEPALYMAAAAAAPFEVQVRRSSYAKPIAAIAVIGGVGRFVPASLLDGWNGFDKALTLTWRSPTGRVLKSSTQPWCPNDGEAGRYSPLGSVTNRYDTFCVSHPFGRSDRWGIERGWATQMLGFDEDMPPLSVGSQYTLQVKLRDALGGFLGIPASARTVTYKVNVVRGPAEDRSSRSPKRPNRAVGMIPRRPAQTSKAAPADTLPDLVSLPALGIQTHTEGGHDELDFGATIYNAGRSPLVVEGFRRGTTGIMDAYQYFYRGTAVAATATVGSLQFDSRPTHQHWHFRDFALYDLVNSAGSRVATSGKEAFCLAPTDAIDVLQPGAVKDPGDSDLATACGNAGSIWVREVLAAGWGDTYTQFRAGQSIDITNLANGTYRIRVTANPSGRLHEISRGNNVSLRTIVLGGTKGARTVKVPPYQLVDSEADIDFTGLAEATSTTMDMPAVG